MARILVVDDEEDILVSLQLTLSHLLPAKVDVAATGREAQAKLAEEPFDVVITDERMPGLRGSELLAWVAAERPEVKRVLMSAYLDPASARKRANPDLFLPKPFDLAKAVRELRSLLPAQPNA